MTTQMRFEVTALPVADVDRAKSFYEGLGWRLDADFMLDEHTRAVQLTPPGSPASIHFREDKVRAGSAQGLLLAVKDIEAARDELIGHGVDVQEIWHFEPGKGAQPGVDPEHRSYASRASFSDPDGNGWVLQELTERLPGRGGPGDVASRAQLLLESALRHGKFEAVAPPHDWWDWYAAYMDAREDGSEPDEAAAAADRYMADVKGVVVPA
jgi:catechol 2,3-dioxygenase-like lactoylglutathione lyase family enzyme